jgi:hypothetical protein
MSQHSKGIPLTEVPVSQRTRPIGSAMGAGSVVCWIVAVLWVFGFADYQIFTVSAAIPLAVASLGLLVLQGWAREISLTSAGLWGIAADETVRANYLGNRLRFTPVAAS